MSDEVAGSGRSANRPEPALIAEDVADHEHVYRCQDCGEIGRAPVAHATESVVALRQAIGNKYDETPLRRVSHRTDGGTRG